MAAVRKIPLLSAVDFLRFHCLTNQHPLDEFCFHLITLEMCFTHCNWSIRVEKESSHGYIKFYFQCSSVVVCPDRSLY